jgi:hypothetical protein
VIQRKSHMLVIVRVMNEPKFPKTIQAACGTRIRGMRLERTWEQVTCGSCLRVKPQWDRAAQKAPPEGQG